MCRLFGMSAGVRPVRATFWLLRAPDSLIVQSRREPDGTGLGWFDPDGTPHISKQPIAASADREFAAQARTVQSPTFVAHIRFASTGALLPQNTHPFCQQGRLFAHNGVIEDLPLLQAQLGDDLALCHGDTDSERFFALITRETAARDGDVAAGIEAAVRWVAANLPIFSINLVLATPHDLWALRYPETHELYVLQRPPGGPLEHASSHGMRVRSEHGATRALVVVASERMDADPGWRLLTSGELLHVHGDPRSEHGEPQVNSRVIVSGPPAHLLGLDDLHPQARASQAGATQPGVTAAGAAPADAAQAGGAA